MAMDSSEQNLFFSHKYLVFQIIFFCPAVFGCPDSMSAREEVCYLLHNYPSDGTNSHDSLQTHLLHANFSATVWKFERDTRTKFLEIQPGDNE